MTEQDVSMLIGLMGMITYLLLIAVIVVVVLKRLK